MWTSKNNDFEKFYVKKVKPHGLSTVKMLMENLNYVFTCYFWIMMLQSWYFLPFRKFLNIILKPRKVQGWKIIFQKIRYSYSFFNHMFNFFVDTGITNENVKKKMTFNCVLKIRKKRNDKFFLQEFKKWNFF